MTKRINCFLRHGFAILLDWKLSRMMRRSVAILALLAVVALQVTSAEEVVPSVKKNKALPSLNRTDYVPCDATTYCLDGQQCCRASWGGYGCCPHKTEECRYPNDFCYDDPKSPPSRNSATPDSRSKMVPPLKYVFCNDGSYCLSGETCCKDTYGGYDCCPLTYAVCCSGGLFCCPHGYYCAGGALCRK